MEVDVKQAVGRARDYLIELFPVMGDVELEEVEPHPARDGWRITFSYDRAEPLPNGLEGIISAQQRPRRRVYKVVTVRSDGTPESVTMRDRSN